MADRTGDRAGRWPTPRTMSAIADHLSLPEFAVVGVSAGGLGAVVFHARFGLAVRGIHRRPRRRHRAGRSRSLADAIAEHVNDPLGMRDTAFGPRAGAALATPYADGTPRAVRMTEPCPVQDLIFSPARAFNDESFSPAEAAWLARPRTS